MKSADSDYPADVKLAIERLMRYSVESGMGITVAAGTDERDQRTACMVLIVLGKDRCAFFEHGVEAYTELNASIVASQHVHQLDDPIMNPRATDP